MNSSSSAERVCDGATGVSRLQEDVTTRHRLHLCAAGVALLLLGSACSGRGQAAAQVPPEAAPSATRFVAISDAVSSNFFDASTSAPDPRDPNSLVIGFDTGSASTTLVTREFKASTLPFSRRAAMDTISFTIRAPSGQFISKVTYTQQGTGSKGRTDVVAGGATWVVAGVAGNLGVFSDDPSLSGTMDLTPLRLTSVPVSITVSLFASMGSVAVTGAAVHVELLPLP